MKIELDNICPSIRKCFFYREDLENMDTEELLHILRCLRIRIIKEVERNSELVDEDKKKEFIKSLEGQMVEFRYDDWHEDYAVLWIVKDVLSKRPHIYKSKSERRKNRQLSAKLHKRIKQWQN